MMRPIAIDMLVARDLAHSNQKCVRSIFGEVERVERGRAVHEDYRGPRYMSAQRAQIDAKWKRGEYAFHVRMHVPPRPLEGEVRKLGLVRILVLATTVLVVEPHGRIVVPRDAGDLCVQNSLHRFVGPGSVANEVAQMVSSIDVGARRDVSEHRVQCRKVRVNVRNERVLHGFFREGCSGRSRHITVAEAGHAP